MGVLGGYVLWVWVYRGVMWWVYWGVMWCGCIGGIGGLCGVGVLGVMWCGYGCIWGNMVGV